MAMDLVGDLLGRLDQLNEIGAALSKEHDVDALLEGILIAAKNITHADGGTLYRITEDGSALRFEIMRTNSLDIFLGGTSGHEVNFPPLQLVDANGALNDSMVATYAAIHDQTVNIADAYTAEGFDFSGTKQFDQRTGYRSQSFLTVPMKNQEGEVIGVLQLINAQEPDLSRVVTFSEADQRLVESLASQAAIVLSNRLLVNQLENLFESFLRMINLAINEESPHSSGQEVARVPALAMMLAEAVNAETDGPYAGYTLTERDRNELRIASLLHDCAKISTPVHITDKATKLQTVVDRISLVDTRFEVLKRDAEIAALRRQLALRPVQDAAAEAAIEADAAAARTALEADRAFLREVNAGRVVMDEEALQRVARIGSQRRWSDPAGRQTPFLSDDERDNLSIRSGTLNDHERELVNRHRAATLYLLRQVPWPKHLKNVPDYAATRGLQFDAQGQAQQVSPQQLSLPAKMLAIAEMFSALTARDRAYKSSMSMAQALESLMRLTKNGQIDAELFDVFMRQKVYRRYARTFLAPDQLDLPQVDQPTRARDH
ncbi:HD domain-containing phosphohydrolase [Variovorax sp. HJSM1_2]|uniref:HD domain-containing phosphohydrolase n=1 Tax=Variovorax sp. HJSM1_2 TaxID=3366263 RepID=UPI003BD7FE2A